MMEEQQNNRQDFWERMARYWWQLPLTLLLVCFVDMVLLFVSEDCQWAYYAGTAMEWVTMLGALAFVVVTVIVVVKDFKRKEKGRAVATIVGLAVSMVLFDIWMLLYGLVAQSAPTYYAERHPIPSDMECNEPLHLEWGARIPDNDSVVSEDDPDGWLTLYGELGGYYWDFYYTALPDGVLFLRLFEATKNEPLSAEQIAYRTETAVKDHTAFGHIEHNEGNGFTIYEGDFEHYYAARVEVWHRDQSGKETKLMEKIYRVDGWMR